MSKKPPIRSKPNTPKCGNCDYWGGNREIIVDKNGYMKNEILELEGLCYNINSNFDNKLREEGRNCVRFFKWTELNKKYTL